MPTAPSGTKVEELLDSRRYDSLAPWDGRAPDRVVEGLSFWVRTVNMFRPSYSGAEPALRLAVRAPASYSGIILRAPDFPRALPAQAPRRLDCGAPQTLGARRLPLDAEGTLGPAAGP
jgi:hypothetical protein